MLRMSHTHLIGGVPHCSAFLPWHREPVVVADGMRSFHVEMPVLFEVSPQTCPSRFELVRLDAAEFVSSDFCQRCSVYKPSSDLNLQLKSLINREES